jgi:hypothetical protein
VVEDVGIFAANSTAGFSVSDNGLLSYRATVPQVVRTSSLSRQEAYVIDFSNATSRIQISAAGARRPLWRTDGREPIYFEPVEGETCTVMAVDIGASATSVVQVGVPLKLFQLVNLRDAGMTPDAQRFLANIAAQPAETAAPIPITVIANWNRAAAP